MFSREQNEALDRKVRRKKKCKPGHLCPTGEDDDVKGPTLPQTFDPEKSAFEHLGVRAYERSRSVAEYRTKMDALIAQMQQVEDELLKYDARIAAGSTGGLGDYVKEGQQLQQVLQHHHSVLRHKEYAFREITTPEAVELYNRYTARFNTHFPNKPHPNNHPKSYSAASRPSRTGIIEDLTNEYPEGYGLEPMSLVEGALMLRGQPSSPQTPPLTPP